MVVDLPRRWRWVIGSGCVVVLVLMGLLVGAERVVERPPPTEPPAAAVAAVAVDAEGALQVPASEFDVAASLPSRGPDEIEVCGGAWIKLPAEPADTPAQIESERRELERATQFLQRHDEVLAALRAMPGDLAAAVASLIEMSDTNDTAFVASTRDALVRIALSTSDPRVYALAFKACGSGALKDGGCQMLSAEQWVRLDPENAAPWLFIFGNANGPQDRPARDEALHRIATATRSDVYFHAAAGALIEAAPPGDAFKLAVYEMAGRLMGVEAAVAIPGYASLTAACRSDALKDANRAQNCSNVAELLAERSSTLLDRAIGTAIGRQIGWPTDRIDRLRGEYTAYAASRFGAVNVDTDFSCAKIDRDLDAVRSYARLGEAGALRDWVLASGKTPEDFIGEQRARERVREAEAAQRKRAEAASAAAASAAADTASRR